LTTHYLEEAEEMCDTIAIINQGNVVACEPTANLLKRLNYKTLVVWPAEKLTQAPTPLADLEPMIRKDGALAITYRTGQSNIEQLIARVRQAGIAINDLATEEPDLEDVFVALTSG